MQPKAPVFEETYRRYLGQLCAIDLPALSDRLGAVTRGHRIVIPCFGTPYSVSPRGICKPDGGRAPFSVSVVLCNYVLMCPERFPLGGDWCAYRGFADAGPLAGYFAANACAPIADVFTGNLEGLEATVGAMGAIPYQDEAAYDLSMELNALPHIPMLLRFNDCDEVLPAECTILFRESAAHYLDMECVAILGSMLAGLLTRDQLPD